MDTSYSISEQFRTDRSFDEVFELLERSLKNAGGSLTSDRSKGTISVIEGKAGILGDFLMEAEANFTLKEKDDGLFLLEGSLTKRPTAIFWVCLVGGICLFWNLIGWAGIAGVVIYFVADLGAEYKKRLAQARTEMGANPSEQPVSEEKIPSTEPETDEEPSEEEKPNETDAPPSD